MPRRRCVGCGRIAPKSELLRIAVADRGSAGDGDGACRNAIVDRHGTMPGRGAYLCRGGYPDQPAAVDRACLERAVRRGGIARALRSPVTLDPKLVESVS
ncbi:MAG: YlxR family protein [Solirubrobacteraceae bacterium]